MPNHQFHNRRSIRFKGYDYSNVGLYFITICVQNRACIFGYIEDGKMNLNNAGNAAKKCWLEIPQHFPNVQLHEYIIMPNHIHGIIEFTVGANNHSPMNNDSNMAYDDNENGAKDVSPLRRSPSKTIGSVVRGFKIGVTKWLHQNNDLNNIWQRNYYEHIICNQQSYINISNYIINNPTSWRNDKYFLIKNS